MSVKKIYNYKIDDWVIYKPYKFSTPKRAVILWIYREEFPLYDYEIYVHHKRQHRYVNTALDPIQVFGSIHHFKRFIGERPDMCGV